MRIWVRARTWLSEGYVNWNASPKTRIYLNFDVNYSHLQSPSQGLKNEGWAVFAYGGAQHTFPLDIRASLNVMGSSRDIMLQGKGSSFYNYNLSLSRSFLKEKRLSVSAYCNNIFNKNRSFKNTTYGEGFRRFSNYSYEDRRFGMSISYRLGSLKASVQKAKRSISNDDVKGGGDSSGGSN